jgi:hypothetical protein
MTILKVHQGRQVGGVYDVPSMMLQLACFMVTRMAHYVPWIFSLLLVSSIILGRQISQQTTMRLHQPGHLASASQSTSKELPLNQSFSRKVELSSGYME